MVSADLVLLSKTNSLMYSDNSIRQLTEGTEVAIYEYNLYSDGEEELLLCEGLVELNNPASNGEWTKAAKWCCRLTRTIDAIRDGELQKYIA